MKILPSFSSPALVQAKHIYILIVMASVLVLGGILAIRDRFFAPSEAQTVSLSAEQEVLQALGRLMVLPAGTPSMELVQDVQLLRSLQPSLVDSLRVGDWLVRYSTMVIVYRSSEQRIVQVLPVSS